MFHTDPCALVRVITNKVHAHMYTHMQASRITHLSKSHSLLPPLPNTCIQTFLHTHTQSRTHTHNPPPNYCPNTHPLNAPHLSKQTF